MHKDILLDLKLTNTKKHGLAIIFPKLWGVLSNRVQRAAASKIQSLYRAYLAIRICRRRKNWKKALVKVRIMAKNAVYDNKRQRVINEYLNSPDSLDITIPTWKNFQFQISSQLACISIVCTQLNTEKQSLIFLDCAQVRCLLLHHPKFKALRPTLSHPMLPPIIALRKCVFLLKENQRNHPKDWNKPLMQLNEASNAILQEFIHEEYEYESMKQGYDDYI
jgi:hypothetical protein